MGLPCVSDPTHFSRDPSPAIVARVAPLQTAQLAQSAAKSVYNWEGTYIDPAQCIPKDGAIATNPAQAGHCAELFVP